MARRRLLLVLLALIAAGACFWLLADDDPSSAPPAADAEGTDGGSPPLHHLPGLATKGKAPPEPAGEEASRIQEHARTSAGFYTPQTAPPDPREPGKATLKLTLLAAHDESPYVGPVHLWRIDAPANANWLQGDRFISAHRTDARGTFKAEELAPGTYRVRVHERRADTEDPPAFQVARDTVRTQTVECAQQLPLRVVLHGPEDRRPESARVRHLMSYARRRRPPATPRWATRRLPKDGTRFLPGLPWEVSALGGRQGRRADPAGSGVLQRAVAGEFALEGLMQAQATVSWTRAWEIAPPGHTPVIVQVGPRGSLEGAYHGATLPLARLHELIRLPDGSRAIDHGAEIEAKGRAMARSEGGLRAPDWRSLTIELVVKLRGHRTLRRTLILDDLPTELTLRARR